MPSDRFEISLRFGSEGVLDDGQAGKMGTPIEADLAGDIFEVEHPLNGHIDEFHVPHRITLRAT